MNGMVKKRVKKDGDCVMHKVGLVGVLVSSVKAVCSSRFWLVVLFGFLSAFFSAALIFGFCMGYVFAVGPLDRVAPLTETMYDIVSSDSLGARSAEFAASGIALGDVVYSVAKMIAGLVLVLAVLLAVSFSFFGGLAWNKVFGRSLNWGFYWRFLLLCVVWFVFWALFVLVTLWKYSNAAGFVMVFAELLLAVWFTGFMVRRFYDTGRFLESFALAFSDAFRFRSLLWSAVRLCVFVLVCAGGFLLVKQYPSSVWLLFFVLLIHSALGRVSLFLLFADRKVCAGWCR